MNARFNMPEFYRGKNIYACLMEQIKDNPDILLPNTEIATIFGTFPASVWNGGGLYTVGSISKEEMRDTIGFFNYELGISLRFTFTNPLVSESQYFDTYSNLIAELGHNGHNQIIVTNPGLENYLRKNYPNYKYCRSIVAARVEPYARRSPFGDYHISVMRRNMNNNWEYLDQIPIEDRPYIEFLCCDPCPDNCPRIYSHYRDFARAQCEYSLGNDACDCSMGKVKTNFPYYNMQNKLKTYISREMIDNDYLPKGFSEFKCSGRGSRVSVIHNILVYMIKPEYWSDLYFAFFDAEGIK